MNSKKSIVLLAISIILLIFLTISICILYDNNSSNIDFVIKDNLPNGQNAKVKVILLGGQSNASGCSRDDYLQKNISAEKYSEYKEGYDNIYINYYVSGNNQSNGFVKCSTLQGEVGGFFGPELGIAEKLNEIYPNEKFFIIKCAWGATELYTQWISPTSPGKTGPMYKDFVKFVNANLKYLESKNYDVVIEGMCWMQGESDSFSEKTATEYEIHLKNFIKDIRKKFSKYASADGIAFIDAYIANNPAYWVYYELVNESKRAVADSSSINVVIDTIAEGLKTNKEPEDSPDIPHYDSLSELKLGNLFAKELMAFFDS